MKKIRVVCHIPIKIDGISFLMGDTFDIISSRAYSETTYPAMFECIINFKGKEYSFKHTLDDTKSKGILDDEYFTMIDEQEYREIILNKLLIS